MRIDWRGMVAALLLAFAFGLAAGCTGCGGTVPGEPQGDGCPDGRCVGQRVVIGEDLFSVRVLEPAGNGLVAVNYIPIPEGSIVFAVNDGGQ